MHRPSSNCIVCWTPGPPGIEEQYILTGSASDDRVTVTCLLDEFRVKDRIIRAGCSPGSETIYLSLESTR